MNLRMLPTVQALLPALALLAAACGGGGRSLDPASISMTQIEAGGFVFDARTAGPSRGELVLLLHGFPQSSLEWEAQLEALGGAGYRAVAPDLRGYSPGARPIGVENYLQSLLAADVVAIADSLGASRFHVVGHDWGASIAWQVAMTVPDRVTSLTAVSVPHPTAFALALAGSTDQQERSRYIDFFQQPEVAEQVLLTNNGAGLRAAYGNGPAAAHADEYVRLLSQPGALTAALNYYRALPLGGIRLDRIIVPTLYVWSTEDSALGRTGAEATGDFVDGPYRFEIIEGVSHWVPEDAAERLSTVLLEHLASVR